MRKIHGGGGHGVNMGDYRQGLTSEIRATIRQLQAEKKAAEEQVSSGTALVIRKDALIAAKYGTQKYSQSKGRTLSQTGAYMDGKIDGHGIKINKAIGSTPAAGELQ